MYYVEVFAQECVHGIGCWPCHVIFPIRKPVVRRELKSRLRPHKILGPFTQKQLALQKWLCKCVRFMMHTCACMRGCYNHRVQVRHHEKCAHSLSCVLDEYCFMVPKNPGLQKILLTYMALEESPLVHVCGIEPKPHKRCLRVLGWAKSSECDSFRLEGVSMCVYAETKPLRLYSHQAYLSLRFPEPEARTWSK